VVEHRKCSVETEGFRGERAFVARTAADAQQGTLVMKKIKLLLVDDESEFLDTLVDRLDLRDLKTDVAYNGKQALSAVEEQEPDVIVLDVKMPEMDGIEVLQRIKKAYPHVEVIILTGHGNEQDEQRARELGAFDYLRKPADLESLLARIRNAFKQRMNRLQQMSMAVTFAEAGELDTAREMMEDEEDSGEKQKDE
jgi:DNA-binding response OmpR family regulator